MLLNSYRGFLPLFLHVSITVSSFVHNPTVPAFAAVTGGFYSVSQNYSVTGAFGLSFFSLLSSVRPRVAVRGIQPVQPT